jgi:hypothetical protein
VRSRDRVPSVPAGYTRFTVFGADVVALEACAEPVRQAMQRTSLYAFAAHHPARRELRGRAAAYAVPLPDGTTRVVVRHSRHGGLLAPVTGDRFLAPTRAPHELATSLRLGSAGVATPEIVAYAVYPAGGPFRRTDIATREVEGGRDLVAVLGDARARRELPEVVDATARLLRTLTRAGARHPDLNAANVLLVKRDGAYRAHVLDVDRVTFGTAGDAAIATANLERLMRSLRKLRSLGRIAISDTELAALATAAGRPT